MNAPIGFVLLVNPFSKLEQSARLIGTLNRMFDRPPIACHHDFGKTPKFIENCPENVRMVTPHINTRWGDFSCVEATIKALRLLYAENEGPDWFVFLSGADYPIKPASTILQDLKNGGFDGYIEHRLISEGDLLYPSDPENLQGWKWEDWLHQCHRRYCSLRVDIPGINRHLRLSKKTFWLEHPFFTEGRIPFDQNFKCYAGEVWFCADRRCARRILDFYDRDRKVAEHYRKTVVPEESYLQTVLGNDPDLKLSQNYLRYIDWTARGSNPKVLTMEDLPAMKRSRAHFARKFGDNVDARVLDKLDKILGI